MLFVLLDVGTSIKGKRNTKLRTPPTHPTAITVDGHGIQHQPFTDLPPAAEAIRAGVPQSGALLLMMMLIKSVSYRLFGKVSALQNGGVHNS